MTNIDESCRMLFRALEPVQSIVFTGPLKSYLTPINHDGCQQVEVKNIVKRCQSKVTCFHCSVPKMPCTHVGLEEIHQIGQPLPGGFGSCHLCPPHTIMFWWATGFGESFNSKEPSVQEKTASASTIFLPVTLTKVNFGS